MISELHNKYGDVVRVAPNELSYAAAEGWNQIYGYRHGKSEIPKDPTFYSSLSSRPESILNAPLSRHGQLRKSISHGFSERALRGQEDVIRGYADRVVERMKGFCDGASAELDMVRWYNVRSA